jgi:hypothetical protein
MFIVAVVGRPIVHCHSCSELKRSSKVTFYYRFPDLLLAQHTTKLRRLYRGPIDMIEEHREMLYCQNVSALFTLSTSASFPLEAMEALKLVIASDSGGPPGRIKYNVTEFQCETSSPDFSSSMLLLLENQDKAKKTGKETRDHL